MGILLNQNNHRPLRVKTGSLAIRCVLGVVGLLALSAPPALHAEEEDIVPAGVLRWEVEVRHDAQQKAYSREDTTSPMLHYLVPDLTVRSQLSGSVSRKYQISTLRLGLGISDHWNLALDIDHGTAVQSSTVQATTTDPAAVQAAADLTSREVSGLGDFSLWSLHRTVYGDYNGFVTGFGFVYPLSKQEGPWLGQNALTVSSFTPGLLGVIHFTHYYATVPARFEFRLRFNYGLFKRVTLPDGTSAKLRTGNHLALNTGWRQEFGPVHLGMSLLGRYLTPSKLDGISQHDPRNELATRVEFGAGNLNMLEQGPLSFPFKMLLWAEHSWRGFNTPVRNELGLSFTSYF